MFEEGLQQHWVGGCLFERVHDFPTELADIIGDEVGQIPILRVAPHLFHRVELRGLRRQPFDDHMATEPGHQPFGCRSVGRQAIHNQDEALGRTATQPTNECLDFLGADVVVVDLEVQSQPPTFGRNGEGGNGRSRRAGNHAGPNCAAPGSARAAPRSSALPVGA